MSPSHAHARAHVREARFQLQKLQSLKSGMRHDAASMARHDVLGELPGVLLH